jgi:hypothetical protein
MGGRASWAFVVVALAATASMAVTSRARAQCAEGRVANEQTQGRCCWPGQTWSPDTTLCTGPPTCPEGRVAQGEDCVPAAGAATGTAGAAGGTATVTATGDTGAAPSAQTQVPTAPPGYGGQPQPGQPMQQGYGQTYQAAPAQPPPPTRTVMRVRKGLLIPGAIVFGVTYGIAVVSAIEVEYGWLAIPFVGPFILMDEVDPDADGAGYAYAGLALWGLAQAAGFTMAILGITLKQEVEVRADLGNGRDIALVPFTPPGGGGVALVGHL